MTDIPTTALRTSAAPRWVRPGRGTAEGVAQALAELQAGDPLGDVIVVVPPGSTAATLRRLLPRVSGGAAGIRFLTPIDLAVELVDSSVSTMRAITTQLQLAAITSVLAGPDCPPALFGVRDHPATIDALVDMAVALRAAHAAPSALRSLAGEPTSVRAALVDVIRRARQCLAAVGVRDESATLAALDAVDEPTLAELRVVLVVTDTFHPAHVPFLARLTAAASCRIVGIVPAAADRSLRVQLHAPGSGEVPAPPSRNPPTVVSCPDPDEEVRHAVRHCARLIDHGIAADDIAIVCAAPASRRPVRDELQRAGIAWSGGAVERVRGSLAGQALRHIVDGVADGWDRPTVFRLLSVAPLYTGLDGVAPRRVGQWTSLCRRLGLVTESDWKRASASLAEAHVARRQRASIEQRDAPPTPREIAEHHALDGLLSLVDRLRRQSKAIRTSLDWSAAARHLCAMLGDHIGTSTWRERAWAAAPAWQRNAADQVERIVAGLGELDHDGVAIPFGATALRQILGTLLDAPVRRRGDAAGAVTITDVGGATCLDAAHVVVVGVNEGVLPASTTDDLLLGRDLPEAAAVVIESPRTTASRAERGWHALLTGDAEVTATFARTDLRRGGEVHPSPLLADLPVVHHRSHADGLLTGHPLTASEQLGRSSRPHAGSRRLGRRVNAIRARLDPHPTEFDGVVGPHPALGPVGGQWAITALERHAACGMSYFGAIVLHVEEETDPAAILAIEPLERGMLVHAVLERLAGEWLALGANERLDWLGAAHLPLARRRAVEILDELASEIGVQHRLGHASAWAAERANIARSLDAAIEAEAAEAIEPVACEHVFHGVEVAGALFAGKIDRIDVLPDGGLRVTDFKTSAPKSMRNPLDDGRRLQLPLYARAADHDRPRLIGDGSAATPPATARYLHIREAKAVPRPIDLGVDVVEAFEQAVGTLVDDVAAGRFVPRAHPPNGHCLMCCVDSLGVEELGERARGFVAQDGNE